jgi:hypothetical protein
MNVALTFVKKSNGKDIMKPFVLYPLIIFAFYLAVPLCSANMYVSGAGMVSVNGLYINMGTHPTDSDGVDYYQKGDIYLYRAIHEGDTFWVIGFNLGSTQADFYYYVVMSSNDTPGGLTMTFNFNSGELPCPQILAVEDAPSYMFISVRNAGTESVNGLYLNMDTHPTDSDGVDYYQKGDIYLYRATDTEEGVKAWIIGSILGGTNMDYNYYGVLSSNDTPRGLTMTFDYTLGEPPCPTMKKNCPVVSVINLLLE